MVENGDTGKRLSSNSDNEGSAQEFLRRAATACAAGDTVIGLHLYLAAFEQASHSPIAPSDAAIEGLKQAWSLSCKLGERALSEYIFDKLEPYLDPEEVPAYTQQLQQLALDKLEEFGLSRDELEDMADAISRDLLGLDDPSQVRTHVMVAHPSTMDKVRSRAGADAGGKGASSKRARAEEADSAPDEHEVQDAATGESEDSEISFATTERITYADLVGYDETIKMMRSFGIGVGNDPDFHDLVHTLNVRHGLNRMPATDTLLFRSPAREDATRFAIATIGELELPTVRLHVEESLAGMPVLCVMAQTERQLRLGSAGSVFEGRGVLMLEDIDLWGAPPVDSDSNEGFGGFMMAHLSRGAREAINLIRTAADNPDVYVIATASTVDEIDPFFCELLEPFTLVDIGHPTVAERIDIWMDVMREHPSMRSVDRAALVKCSAHLPRYDIYMAAREAIEEAYKEGLALRKYVPVTSENIFEKLAAYQPLDSDEYRELEDAVIRDFRRSIDEIDRFGTEV